MTIPKLSKRLRAAADFVRKDSFIADIGTDHAYLPIALLAEGQIRGGVVSDIHRGPIDRATRHIQACGMAGKLIPVLCNGLDGLESFAPEDIFILGMGGELIADILAKAPLTRKAGVRLILQPMTHPERLRRYLYGAGYTVTEEALVSEEKIYQILCAEYTGQTETLTDAEAMFGKHNLRRGDALVSALLSEWESILQKRMAGKQTAGADVGEEEALLREIGEWKHDSL